MLGVELVVGIGRGQGGAGGGFESPLGGGGAGHLVQPSVGGAVVQEESFEHGFLVGSSLSSSLIRLGRTGGLSTVIRSGRRR